MSNFEPEEKVNFQKSSTDEQEIGTLAQALDEVSIWERMKVGKATLKKVGYALLGYIIVLIIMGLLV
ncbi:MAG: hypothetical protein ABEI54_03765 [Candidatus Bipolaricaulia bacterium]